MKHFEQEYLKPYKSLQVNPVGEEGKTLLVDLLSQISMPDQPSNEQKASDKIVISFEAILQVSASQSSG